MRAVDEEDRLAASGRPPCLVAGAAPGHQAAPSGCELLAPDGLVREPGADRVRSPLRPGPPPRRRCPPGPLPTRTPALKSVACASTSACAAVGAYQDSSDRQQGLLLTGPP